MLSTSISRIVKISVAVLPWANKERITDLDIITKESWINCLSGECLYRGASHSSWLLVYRIFVFIIFTCLRRNLIQTVAISLSPSSIYDRRLSQKRRTGSRSSAVKVRTSEVTKDMKKGVRNCLAELWRVSLLFAELVYSHNSGLFVT